MSTVLPLPIEAEIQTRTVYDRLLLNDRPLVGKTLVIEQQGAQTQPGGVIGSGTWTSLPSDAQGDVKINLPAPGHYVVQLPSGEKFPFYLDAGDEPVRLRDLLLAAIPPDDPNYLSLLALLQEHGLIIGLQIRTVTKEDDSLWVQIRSAIDAEWTDLYMVPGSDGGGGVTIIDETDHEITLLFSASQIIDEDDHTLTVNI